MGTMSDSSVRLAIAAAGASFAVAFCIGKSMGKKEGPASFVARLDEAKSKNITIVTAEKAKSIIKSESPVIIDVRDSGDIKDGIKGAVNIPLSNLVFMADQDFTIGEDVKKKGETIIPKGTKLVAKQLTGPKNKSILVSCGLGGQALIGAGILADYGFTNVKVVDGGNIAWANSGGESCECMK